MAKYVYCSVDDLITDLGLPGGDNVLERFIMPASQYITQEIGPFLPVIETRTLAGSGKKLLIVDPLLSVTSIVNEVYTLVATDYLLEPPARMWPYGPYTRINLDIDRSTAGCWDDDANSVVIAGKWGLYERIKALDVSLAAAQLLADSSLQIDDGSKLSPGMMLQIESEWQFVSGYGAITANATTLAGALDGSSETLNLTSGAALNIGEIIKVGFEQMRILDIQDNAAFVERGWAKTKKVSHLTSSPVGVYRTFTVERGANGSTAAGHSEGAAISQLQPPDDVNYLCRQIAALMLRKSQTNYAGRAGSSETGETFYHHEFPKDVIERIRRNYFIPRSK